MAETISVEALLEKAKMEFQNGLDREALLDFISVYEQSGEQQIYEWILEAYYAPNREELLETYHSNLRLLEEYPHYRDEFESERVEYVPIWLDEEIIVCADLSARQFAMSEREPLHDFPDAEQAVMLVNVMWLEDILQCEEKSGIRKPLLDKDWALYLVFDKVYWLLFAQLYDITPLLVKNRIVFLVGQESAHHYFMEDQAVFPNCMNSNGRYSVYDRIITQRVSELQKQMQQELSEYTSYYRDNEDELLARIRTQKPRILFWTSRFTTALQYHMRDCKLAAERLGCETRLLIEKDGIHRICNAYAVKVINEFKPDIIFCIDHFRFEYTYIPKEVVCVTWIQDTMPDIMSTETPQKLTDRDIVMNHFVTSKRIQEIGYDSNQMMDAPISANPYIYKSYELTEEEYHTYSCDICMVCHTSDVDGFITKFVNQFPENLREPVYVICQGYRSYVYETGDLFYSKEAFEQFISGSLVQHYGIMVDSATLEAFAEDMQLELNQRLFRQAIADWLIEAGYTNLKLWGDDWLKEKRYEKYAMGPAENGATLSKILQSSKIVLGNNAGATGAARAWETMLSGAFYMSNYVPPEEDYVDIRKDMTEGENLVIFHNKQDLLDKVAFYLSHEDERKQMAEKGTQFALEHRTYEALMKKMLCFLSEKF